MAGPAAGGAGAGGMPPHHHTPVTDVSQAQSLLRFHVKGGEVCHGFKTVVECRTVLWRKAERVALFRVSQPPCAAASCTMHAALIVNTSAPVTDFFGL